MLLLADSAHDLQALLDVVLDYSTKERYIIHPSKSMIVIFNNKSSSQCSWSLGSKSVPVEKVYKHLGINRFSQDTGSTQLIADCITTARRASYALMGAGFHGNNGLSIPVIRQMYLLYIIPRCTYGLEALILKKSHLAALERYHRRTLRQLMSLPDRTANEAVHLLIGLPPITAFIHAKALGLLGAISRSPDSLLHHIGLRQLSVKDLRSPSWFIYLFQITSQYGLPSPHELFQAPIKKHKWKIMVRKAVYEFYKDQLIQDARSKSTLEFMDLDALNLDSPAKCLMNPDPTETDVTRSRTFLRLLTGTYIFLATQARFNQYPVDPTCQLCRTEPEDMVHFLATCPVLDVARQRYLAELRTICPDLSLMTAGNPKIFCQLLLCPSKLCPEGKQRPGGDTLQGIYFINRRFIHSLHVQRNKFLISLHPLGDRLLLRGGKRR